MREPSKVPDEAGSHLFTGVITFVMGIATMIDLDKCIYNFLLSDMRLFLEVLE